VSLKKFISKGFILAHPLKEDEITRLLKIADRDITEASEKCHEIDWQFAIAYNAALQLASAVLRASGYRASTKVGHHWATFSVLPDVMGDDFRELADYFNDCRSKRNTIEYCDSGTITKQAAEELIDKVKVFKTKVIAWLKKPNNTL
jgi:uncharacterized protein (UPF0332 family)